MSIIVPPGRYQIAGDMWDFLFVDERVNAPSRVGQRPRIECSWHGDRYVEGCDTCLHAWQMDSKVIGYNACDLGGGPDA